MKILIIGARGFVGKNLRDIYSKEHEVDTIYRNSKLPINQHYDLIIDASSQKNEKDLEAIYDTLSFLSENNKVEKIIILQSFSTLHSKPSDPNKLNFGSEYNYSSLYSNLKRKKEEAFSNFECVSFAYLPVILGVGGIWDEHKKNLEGKSNVIQDVDVYFCTIKFMASSLLDCSYSKTKRVLVVEGEKSLYSILGKPPYCTISQYYLSKPFDKFLLNILKKTKSLPILSMFILAFARFFLLRRHYFSSFFYWSIFQEQSKFIELDRDSKL
ncbi:hypothetical protein AB0530_000852 [Vibrio parahaemolyticus]